MTGRVIPDLKLGEERRKLSSVDVTSGPPSSTSNPAAVLHASSLKSSSQRTVTTVAVRFLLQATGRAPIAERPRTTTPRLRKRVQDFVALTVLQRGDQ